MKKLDRHEVAVLDRYTMQEIGRFPSVRSAARELGLKANSVYVAISTRKPLYDCYWLYVMGLPEWMPAKTCYRRVNGIRVPEKLLSLINKGGR